MRFSRFVTLLAATLLLAACATALSDGFDAYSQGRYDEAASHWSGPALRGDPVAQFNIGVLWENGQGSTPRNLNVAAQWYYKSGTQGYIPAMVALGRAQVALGHRTSAKTWFNLAARWNDLSAANELIAMGEPVPSADLFAAQEAQRMASQQILAQGVGRLAYGATCALKGGCDAQGNPTTAPDPGSINIRCRPVDIGGAVHYRCKN